MPELPDLQIFAKNLNSIFKGKKLVQLKVVNNKKIKDKEADLSSLEGRTLKSVYRTGKELRFSFGNDTLLGMHLMLHGNLYLFDKNNNGNKFTIAELYFNNKGLALTDWQAMATITLNPEDKKGIDALSEELNYNYLTSVLQSKAKIKSLITNQNIIRGIGNAYADEILWEARISPFSTSSAISENKVHALEKAIKNVLKNAEAEIAKTHPEIITGEVRNFLKIHTREKDSSPTGAPIKVDKNAGRTTYYTEEQELFV